MTVRALALAAPTRPITALYRSPRVTPLLRFPRLSRFPCPYPRSLLIGNTMCGCATAHCAGMGFPGVIFDFLVSWSSWRRGRHHCGGGRMWWWASPSPRSWWWRGRQVWACLVV
ncbi:hypothetical protein FB451DRAFT_1231302, partial [Mycena latifolia]